MHDDGMVRVSSEELQIGGARLMQPSRLEMPDGTHKQGLTVLGRGRFIVHLPLHDQNERPLLVACGVKHKPPRFDGACGRRWMLSS
jgi:hypothetical protein